MTRVYGPVTNPLGVVDVLCDAKWKNCLGTTRDKLEHTRNMHFATLIATWGYGSRRDGERHEIHFCENCYDELLAILKAHEVRPTITEYGLLGG